MKRLMKYSAKKILSTPILKPFSEIFSIRYSGKGTILMFHRVVASSKNLVCEDIEVTKDYLESVIRYFQKKNYKAVSLDTAHKILRGEMKIDYKFVVYTFDDGYIDNYKLAYPLFKKYNIPFTIYLTTSFPDNSAQLWWYALKDLLKKVAEVEIVVNDKKIKFPAGTAALKQEAYVNLRRIILDQTNGEYSAIFEQLFTKNGIFLDNYVRELSLNWDQIRELAADPLVTIGAHTVNHTNLLKLDLNTAYMEIKSSKDRIEKKINQNVNHFAYPYGSKYEAGKREFEIVGNLGFKTATTTRSSNIFIEHANLIYSLPRITLSPYTESAYPHYYSSGLIPAIRNKFKKIVLD